MIKCDWYWRLLKLSFFGLLISFFTLFVGSSVSASFQWSHYQLVWLSSSNSFLDSQYEIRFLRWGWLNTMFLWQARNIFALNSSVMFWWDNNWMPYFYRWKDSQWNFTTARSCDSLSSWWQYVLPSNCSSFDIDSWIWPTIFKSFFSTVSDNDVVYYYYGSDDSTLWIHEFELCFNSEELNKSLCFKFCDNYYHNCGLPLSWSLWLDVSFTTVPYWVVWNAPWQNWYMGNYEWTQGDWLYWNVDWFITGSVFQQKCTVWYAKNYAENLWLSNYLCYWWLPLDSDWLAIPIAWTGASVFEIYNASSDWKNFQSWFQYWQNIYTNRLVYDSSVWSGTPAPLYSYFNFVSQYWLTFTARDIQDYCRIILNNMDLNSFWHGTSAWCPKVYWNWYSPWWGWGGSWDDDTWTWVQDNNSNNNVNISVNWHWVWNHTWNEVKTPSAYIQDFFNKAREVIPTNFSDIWGWFLPTYIITFLCAIILFRFLRH